MAVNYKKLFHLLIEKDMTNAQLQREAGFSANIIMRLKRGGYISLESVESICRVLNCGVENLFNFFKCSFSGPSSSAERLSPHVPISETGFYVTVNRKVLKGGFPCVLHFLTVSHPPPGWHWVLRLWRETGNFT